MCISSDDITRDRAKKYFKKCNRSRRTLAKHIQSKGGKAQFWVLDTTQEKVVKQVFLDIHTTYKKLTGLINNAGINGSDKPTHELSEKEWDEVMNVNVKGTFFCTKHIIPYLQKQGGSIVNVSSVDGIVGQADFPPYYASKAAVRLMAKHDAISYAKNNIRVNSIHSGYIWTPMLKKQAEKHPQGVDAFIQEAKNLHPLGFLGEPQDVAYGILYLMSDESKFMTGSELIIDGGFTAQ